MVGSGGAFSTNGVGLEAAPFPLSFSVSHDDGTWTVDATAATARELADVLTEAAGGTIVVLDIATNDLGSPSRIAAHQGVGFRLHDVGNLHTVGLSQELLVLRPSDLGAFLRGWYPYELTLADFPGEPTADQLDELALTVGTRRFDVPVLPQLPGSRFFFSGHDDCYLAIESADARMPASLLGRLLALQAGSARAPIDVPEPERAAVAGLIERSPNWVGSLVPGDGDGDAVRIELAATGARWRPGSSLPQQVDHTLVYDVAHRAWR